MISEGITDLLSKGTPFSWLKMKCRFEIPTISINAVKITLLFKKKARKMRSSMLWMCHLELHRCKVDGRVPTYLLMIAWNCPFRDFYFTDLSKASKFMFCPHWTKLLHVIPRQNWNKTALLGAKPTIFLGFNFSPSFSTIRELWKTEIIPLESTKSKKL